MIRKYKVIGYCFGVYLFWEILGFLVQYFLAELFPQLQESNLGNYIFTICSDLIVFLVCLVLFRRHLYSFEKEKMSFLVVALLPIYISVSENMYIIFTGQPIYTVFDLDFIKIFLVIAIATVMIAICEEFIWRRIIFSKLLYEWQTSTKGVYGAVFVASAGFGICHYMNILTAGQSFQETTSQVLNAFCVGIFLAGLYYRTGRIIVPVGLHCISDFSNLFMNEILDYTYDLPAIDGFLSLIVPILYFVVGVYSIKTSTKYKALIDKA